MEIRWKPECTTDWFGGSNQCMRGTVRHKARKVKASLRRALNTSNGELWKASE